MRSNEINQFQPDLDGCNAEVQTIEGEIAHASYFPKKVPISYVKSSMPPRKNLQDLEKTSDVFAKAQTEYLKEKVVTLSRDLVDRLVEKEVTQIQKESLSLKRGNVTPKELIKMLETHIHQLEENHKTSIPHRRIIADAKQALVGGQGQARRQASDHTLNGWLNSKIRAVCRRDRIDAGRSGRII